MADRNSLAKMTKCGISQTVLESFEKWWCWLPPAARTNKKLYSNLAVEWGNLRRARDHEGDSVYWPMHVIRTWLDSSKNLCAFVARLRERQGWTRIGNFECGFKKWTCSNLQNHRVWTSAMTAANEIKHATRHLSRWWRCGDFRGESCIEGQFGSERIPAEQQMKKRIAWLIHPEQEDKLNLSK